MTSYRPRQPAGHFPVFVGLVLLFFALLGVFFGVRAYDDYRDREDMTALLELEAAHGTASNGYRQAKPGSPQAREFERLIRKYSADHNTILARHPTWLVKPLDTLVLTEPPYKGK